MSIDSSDSAKSSGSDESLNSRDESNQEQDNEQAPGDQSGGPSIRTRGLQILQKLTGKGVNEAKGNDDMQEELDALGAEMTEHIEEGRQLIGGIKRGDRSNDLIEDKTQKQSKSRSARRTKK